MLQGIQSSSNRCCSDYWRSLVLAVKGGVTRIRTHNQQIQAKSLASGSCPPISHMPEAGVLGAWVEARRTSYPATVLKLLGPRLEPSIFLQSLNIKLEAQTKLKPWSWSWFWISEPPDFALSMQAGIDWGGLLYKKVRLPLCCRLCLGFDGSHANATGSSF